MTLCYAALLPSCRQLTCTDVTWHCWPRTRVLVNIILLVAKIIPDNWCCFCFWHQVFVLCDLLLFVAHFSMLLAATRSMCRSWSASTHWIRTNVIGGSGTLEIRWVHLPPTSQALRCDYCKCTSRWRCSNNISRNKTCLHIRIFSSLIFALKINFLSGNSSELQETRFWSDHL